jgi:hypothetical protein
MTGTTTPNDTTNCPQDMNIQQNPSDTLNFVLLVNFGG